jgi:hypothetical protein
LAKSQRAAGHRLPSPSPSQQNVAAHPLFFFDRALSLPSSLSNRLSCSRLPFNSQTAAPPSSLSFLSRSNKPIAPQSRSPSPPHRRRLIRPSQKPAELPPFQQIFFPFSLLNSNGDGQAAVRPATAVPFPSSDAPF